MNAAPVQRWARVDVIGGAVMVVLAVMVGWGSIGLRLGPAVNFGPGALPLVLASVLALIGAAILLRGLLQPAGEAEALHLALRPVLVLGLAIVIFALFIRGGDVWLIQTPRLGLMVVGPLTVFLAGLATPEANPKELLVMAFALTAAILLVFADLLGVPIPVFPEVLADAIPPAFGTQAALRVLYASYAAISAGAWLLLFVRPGRRDV